MSTVVKGTVRGRVIEPEAGARLPDGAQVQIIVVERPSTEAPQGGTLQVLLSSLNTPPQATVSDVDALEASIDAGRRRADFRGVFDRQGPA